MTSIQTGNSVGIGLGLDTSARVTPIKIASLAEKDFAGRSLRKNKGEINTESISEEEQQNLKSKQTQL